MPGAWEIRVVDMLGANPNGGAPLVLANPTSITPPKQALNEIGTASFALGTFDPQALELRPEVLIEREVQFWRGGECKWWGKVTKVVADHQTVTFTCKSLLWYFSRLFFGPNQGYVGPLANDSFEYLPAGTAVGVVPYWTGTGVLAQVAEEGTATPPASPFATPARGDKHVTLTTALAPGETAVDAEGKNAYISQTVRSVVGNLARPYSDGERTGLLITAAGWYRTHLHQLSPGVNLWTGPAAGEYGLYIERRSVPGNAFIEANWASIPKTTPIDKWTRLECSIVQPANTTEDIQLRLYAPGMLTDWDAISLTYPESVGSVANGSPVADVMRDIVLVAAQTGAAKSDLNIGFAGTGGKLIERDYQYADHGNIFSALAEYPSAGLADFEIVVNAAGTTRTFTVYPEPA